MPPHALTLFHIPLLLHRLGDWGPKKRPGAVTISGIRDWFAEDVVTPAGFREDDEIFPLVASLGVDRKQADAAAHELLPGYLLAYNKAATGVGAFPVASSVDRRLIDDEIMIDYFPEEWHIDYSPEAWYPVHQVCVDAALVIGVLARTNSGFYKSDHSPDYTLQNLLGLEIAFSDSRLSGEPLHPLLKKNSE